MEPNRSWMAGIGVAASVVLGASPALAHDADAAQSASHPPAASVTVTTPGAALTVVRDAETGRLRAPTAEDAQALAAAARGSNLRSSRIAPSASTVPAAPRAFSTPAGARGLTLGEETLSFAVAKRRPDGTVAEACVTGADEAARHLAEPAPRAGRDTASAKGRP